MKMMNKYLIPLDLMYIIEEYVTQMKYAEVMEELKHSVYVEEIYKINKICHILYYFELRKPPNLKYMFVKVDEYIT